MENNLNTFERIYLLIRKIPKGNVLTYGQIAASVGGISARVVGYALAGLPEKNNVPWQRVVNRQGRISPRGGVLKSPQKEMLESEGITFLNETLDFKRVGWKGPSSKWCNENGFLPIERIQSK